MTTRLIKWVIIAVLVAALGWGAYLYGRSIEREIQAEARTEAVAEARREAERRLMQQVDRARQRAREHAKRVEDLQGTVRELERTAAEYAASDAGQQQCLGPEGRERFNAL